MATHKRLTLNSTSVRQLSIVMKIMHTFTVEDLLDRCKLARSSVTSVIKLLLDDEKVYISDWQLREDGTPQRVLTWGIGDSVPPPSFRTKRDHKVPDMGELLPWPRCDVAAAWMFNEVLK